MYMYVCTHVCHVHVYICMYVYILCMYTCTHVYMTYMYIRFIHMYVRHTYIPCVYICIHVNIKYNMFMPLEHVTKNGEAKGAQTGTFLFFHKL